MSDIRYFFSAICFGLASMGVVMVIRSIFFASLKWEVHIERLEPLKAYSLVDGEPRELLWSRQKTVVIQAKDKMLAEMMVQDLFPGYKIKASARSK